jgi:hypothetical protein
MDIKEDYERYKKASKKVEEIKGFYSHLIAYIFIIVLITIVNLKYSPGYYWFFYPMIGWGIGLFFHGVGVFGSDYILGRNWEERKMKQFIEEEKKK